jgi:multidrug efflux pump subunit AcrB
MIKTSVKKPFTVLVAVIMVLVLGVVSLTSMTTDLLPPMSLPYLIVVTTYPGASPEKVEAEVVRPMESALGTISGVSNVYSTSAENYGMVQLEFEDGTVGRCYPNEVQFADGGGFDKFQWRETDGTEAEPNGTD